MTQQKKILELLRQYGSNGINSYKLTFDYGIKQAPTRVYELIKLGYNIVSIPQKDKSVNYILLSQPTKNHQEEVRKEKEWVFIGNTAYLKSEPEQISI